MHKERLQQLILKMLNEHQSIKSVTATGPDFTNVEEYYFTFPDDKYLWSLTKSSDGEIHIFFYPNKSERSIFLRFGPADIDSFYRDRLKQLFETVRGKLYGFDGVLSDILDEEL